jgi:hypothetical protein
MLDGIRAAHAKAREVDRDRARVEIEGGPAEAVKAAIACGEAFAAARRAGVDGGIIVEIERKRPRPLQESADECAQIQARAADLVRQQDRIMKARRKQWRAILKGSRRKIFDAHPAQLPGFASAPEDWHAVATAASWTYSTPQGVEVYRWKGNTLLGRTEKK